MGFLLLFDESDLKPFGNFWTDISVTVALREKLKSSDHNYFFSYGSRSRSRDGKVKVK